MPTSRPPRAPTSSVGSGRIVRVRVALGAAAADPAQVDVEAQGVRRRGEQQREADAHLEHVVDLVRLGEPGDQVWPEQGHRHRAEDQPLGEREVGGALAGVHHRAAGLVDRGGGQVGGDHGRGVADAEEDQRRRHQRAAAHAGQADHDADEEAGGEDREEGGGDEVGHGDLSVERARASRVSLLTHVDFAKPSDVRHGRRAGHVRSSSPSRARAATTSSTQSSIVRPVVSTRTAASSGSS